MNKLDEMYMPAIRAVLNSEDGRDFFVYILRKLGYCNILKTNDDVIVRNAAIGLLEDMIDIAGIRIDVLKIY